MRAAKGADLIEVAAIPRSSRATHNLVTLALVAVMLLGVVGFGLAVFNRVSPPSAGPAPAPPNFTASAGVASSAVQAFLRGEKTSMPVARGFDPAFGIPAGNGPLFEVVTGPDLIGSSGGTFGQQTFQTHIFRFTTADGGVYDATVTTAQDSKRLTVIAGLGVSQALLGASGETPALEADSFLPTVSGGASSAVADAISRWATAFAGGDSEQLRVATGDPNPGSYRGLGGFELAAAPNVLEVVTRPEDEMVIAQVRLGVRRPAANGVQLTLQYDLLLTETDTQVPKVVAWGGPGTGLTLEPYRNRAR